MQGRVHAPGCLLRADHAPNISLPSHQSAPLSFAGGPRPCVMHPSTPTRVRLEPALTEKVQREGEEKPAMQARPPRASQRQHFCLGSTYDREREKKPKKKNYDSAGPPQDVPCPWPCNHAASTGPGATRSCHTHCLFGREVAPPTRPLPPTRRRLQGARGVHPGPPGCHLLHAQPLPQGQPLPLHASRALAPISAQGLAAARSVPAPACPLTPLS